MQATGITKFSATMTYGLCQGSRHGPEQQVWEHVLLGKNISGPVTDRNEPFSSRGTHTMLVLAANSTIKMKREYPK